MTSTYLRQLARLAWITAAVALAACGPNASPSSPPTTTPKAPPTVVATAAPTAPVHRIIGRFTLADATHQDWSATSCHGVGGYDDIYEGTQVVVRNDADLIIATGSLEFDKIAVEGPSGSVTYHCVFDFTIKDVPDAPFYSIEVSHRGAQTYSRADLEAKHWVVALFLGTD